MNRINFEGNHLEQRWKMFDQFNILALQIRNDYDVLAWIHVWDMTRRPIYISLECCSLLKEEYEQMS